MIGSRSRHRREERRRVLTQALPGIEQSEVERLLAAAAVHRFVPDEVLIQEGRASTRVLVIVAGRVEVDAGKEPIRILGPGHLAGEMGVLHEHPRTANVVARTEGEALVIGKADFLGVVARSPGLASRLSSEVAERHEQLARTNS